MTPLREEGAQGARASWNWVFVAQDVKLEELPSQVSEKLDSRPDCEWEGGEGNYTNWPFYSQRVYQAVRQ